MTRTQITVESALMEHTAITRCASFVTGVLQATFAREEQRVLKQTHVLKAHTAQRVLVKHSPVHLAHMATAPEQQLLQTASRARGTHSTICRTKEHVFLVVVLLYQRRARLCVPVWANPVHSRSQTALAHACCGMCLMIRRPKKEKKETVTWTVGQWFVTILRLTLSFANLFFPEM